MSGILGLLIGRKLCDRYRIDSLLGTGGMGAVCRAFDLKLEREVAVKVMTAVSPDAEEQERLRQRFYREARAAARLRHPNVVTIHDFGTDPEMGIDFLVMELLAGDDLLARMRRAGGALAIPEALEIAREAAMGLAAGHRAGLVHRDVKPGNVFLVAEPGGWEVKVLDFGIAQIASDADTLTRLTVFGSPHTPRYASPEQLRGAAQLTPASDVYSLALTALEMLTGEYPKGVNTAHTDTAAAAVLRRVRDRGAPPHVIAALYRALMRDAHARPKDADAFLEALGAAGWEPQRPMPGAPPAPAGDAQRPAPREFAGIVATPPPSRSPALDRSLDHVWGQAPRSVALARSQVQPEPEPPYSLGRDIGMAITFGMAILFALVVAIVGLPDRDEDVVPTVDRALSPALRTTVTDSTEWRTVARSEAMRVSGLRAGIEEGDSLWMVVVASYPAADFGLASAVRDDLHRRGTPAGVANPAVYPQLVDGHYTVVAGPYGTRARAEAARRDLAGEATSDGAPEPYLWRVTWRFP